MKENGPVASRVVSIGMSGTGSTLQEFSNVAKPTVLIVDDDASVRDALSRWFARRGFNPIIACDGVEGVERARESEPDAIVMDMEMPRMNGTDAIREIQQHQPGVPIIVLTGYSDETLDALRLGARRIMVKPVRLMELEEVVRSYLENSSPGPSASE